MTDAERARAILEVVRATINNLPDREKLGVLACAEEFRIVMTRYSKGEAQIALALLGAQASLENADD